METTVNGRSIAELAMMNARTATWAWHINNNLVVWDPLFNDWFDLPREKNTMEFTEMLKVIHRDDRESVNNAIFRCLDHHTAIDICFRLYLGERRELWLQVRGNVVWNEEDTAQLMVGVMQDVTTQKERELRMRQSVSELEYLRMAVDSHAMLLLVDDQGIVSYAGAGVTKFTGFQPDELINHPLKDFLREEHQGQLNSLFKTLGKQQTWVGEMLFKRAYNEPIFVSVTAVTHDTGRDKSARWVLICSDVSSQRAMESALIESESRYYALFENSPEGIARLSLDGLIFEANRPFRKMLGCFENEMPVINYADIAPGFASELQTGTLNQVLDRNGYSPVLEREFVNQHGETFPVNIRFILQRDAKGNPSSLWAVCRDISERKQTEHALKESEAQFRSLVENAPEGIVVIDVDSGAIVDVNLQACDLFKVNRNALLDTSLVEFSPQQQSNGVDSGEMFLHYLTMAESGQRTLFEWTARDSRDHELTLEIGLTRMPSDSQNLVHASIIDISPRKRLERQMLESQYRLRSLFEHSAIGILMIEKGGRILNANPAILNALRQEKSALIGESIASLMPEGDDDGFFDLLGMVLDASNAATFRDEMYLKSADAEQIFVRFSLTRVTDSAGVPSFAILMCEDVTQQKRLERQLEQSKKMETLGLLTGGIAHDFNNMLASVMGYAAMAKQRVFDLDDEKLEDYLDQIELAGERAKNLIQQMLTYGRGAKGEPKLVPLAPLVNETLKMIRSTIPSSVEINASVLQSASVLIDPVQFNQVMLNLVVNARDACDEQGVIDVRLEEVSLSHEDCAACHHLVKGHWVALTVSDNGQGIEKEHLEDVFDPFFTTKTAGKGTGMGLSTVLGIVHEAGGHILLASQPGEGAKFTVLLPPKGKIDNALIIEKNQPRVESHAHGEGQRVMIVDDEPSVAAMLEEFFNAKGFNAQRYVKPQEALREFEQNPNVVDVVISDQTMPGMLGLEMAEKMKALRPDVPIIICTGFSESLTAEKANAIGIERIFYKPLDLPGLAQAVDSALAKRV